ncbi:MAG: hypothetical protein KAY50_09670 [Chitinophagaceae bacterium]|nr:hypothetical protein [Chitinophagaceae bacterium]
MDNTSIAIISGLLSSLSTILVTKLLDIFQNKKQHRYNIEKLYFEKKIAAAELIVSQLTILSGAIMHSTILFERLKEKDYFADDKFEDNVDESLEATVGKLLKQADNTLFIIANTLTLYFDIGENILFAKDYSKETHDLLGQIGIKLETRENAYNYFEKVMNTTEHNKAVDAFNLANEQYKDHLQLVVNKYDWFYKELLSILKLIRKDISRYEVQ